MSPNSIHAVAADRHWPAGPGRAVRGVPDLAARRGSRAAQRPGNRRADRLAAAPVAKRCENIRDRYVRLGAPGLRGPRALEELALLLVSTGELTCAACPPRPHPADRARQPWHFTGGQRAADAAEGSPMPADAWPDGHDGGPPARGRLGGPQTAPVPV